MFMPPMIVDKNKKNALVRRLNKANIDYYFVEDENMIMIPSQLEVTSHITENGIKHYLNDEMEAIDRFMAGHYDVYMESFGVDIGFGYIVEREDPDF